MIWDVAVIGSGPAGNAVAIHCRNAGLHTGIFSASPRRAGSSIPETLPVTARPLLESLGIPEPSGLRPRYAMSSAWGSDFLTTRHSICDPSGPGWFVDRPAFDATLALRATALGAVSFSSARIAFASRENGSWDLRFHVQGESAPLQVKAGFVVDASGRASAFARRIGVRRIAFDRLISASARAIPRGCIGGEALVESASDGWWFSAQAADGELSVTWFTDAGLLRPSDRLLDGFGSRLQMTAHTAARVASLVPGVLTLRPARTDRLAAFSGDNWIAVGDAALACDPLGSQGLLRALESAGIAAELFVRNPTDYAKNVGSYGEFHIYYLQQFLREQHYFYSMERRWPDSPFWRTRG